MVGALVKLQWQLTIRGVRGSTARLVATILVSLYVLGIVLALAFALSLLRRAPELRGPLLTVLFGGLTLLWPIITMMMAGSNELLDPGRFALYPVSARRLLPGLLAAAMIGLGTLSLMILGVSFVVAFSPAPSAAIAALVALAIGTVTCVVSSRAATSYFSAALLRRKVRDLAVVIMVVGLFAVTIGAQVLTSGFDGADNGLLAVLEPVGALVGWTPFGWAWSLPWEVESGAWAIAGVKLIGALVYLGLLLWLWQRSLAKGLVSPLEVGGSGQKIRASLWIDHYLPTGPVGAIAGRGLRYWRRDPRRLIQFISLMIVPALMAVPFALNPDQENFSASFFAYLPVFSAMMAGSAIAWDISYDGSALWMQIITGASGRDDRLGRALAFLVLFGPLQLVITFGFLAWSGRWDLAPGVVGCVICAALAGIGSGSWVGAMWQQAQPPTGGNAFARGSGSSMETLLGSMIGLVLPLLVTAPAFGLALLANWYPWAGWAALAIGIGLGLLAARIGINAGGRRLDANWPEVLSKVTWKG